MKISFCTTCMNYAHYLKQTYLKNILIGLNYNCNFILINYNSSDDMDDWIKDNLQKYINSKILIYFYTKKPKEFNMSKAKNMAHKLGDGDILINLDADNFLTKEYIDWIIDLFNKRNDIITQGRGHGCGGRVAVRKEDYIVVGGYDESLNRPSTGIDHVNFCSDVEDKLNKKIIITPQKLCPYLGQTAKEKMKLLNITILDRKKHELNNR